MKQKQQNKFVTLKKPIMKTLNLLISMLIVISLFSCETKVDESKGDNVHFTEIEEGNKPSPDAVLAMLREGNKRFYQGESLFPHADSARLNLAGTKNQGDYAYATVISCSDSRVPVELIFDAGIMDLFIIRVAGNVIDTDEAGSIEYGLAHVNTPVLVVLGHTQCGAVTAVTRELQGHGHKLEVNIPPLVDNIIPAVEKAMQDNKDATTENIISRAIEENIWQGIRDLFMRSPASRELVKEEKVKVVGAIYDVSTGKIDWLDEAKPMEILEEVLANPARETMMYAGTEEENASSH